MHLQIYCGDPRHMSSPRDGEGTGRSAAAGPQDLNAIPCHRILTSIDHSVLIVQIRPESSIGLYEMIRPCRMLGWKGTQPFALPQDRVRGRPSMSKIHAKQAWRLVRDLGVPARPLFWSCSSTRMVQTLGSLAPDGLYLSSFSSNQRRRA